MASSFRGHVVGPFNACIVVIEKEGGRLYVREIVSGLNHACADVAKMDNLFGGSICCTNFCFTRAERRLVLTVGKPTDRSASPKHNATAHTPEFEQREEGTISNSTTNLRPPTR
jgi:hypothetical protein